MQRIGAKNVQYNTWLGEERDQLGIVLETKI